MPDQANAVTTLKLFGAMFMWGGTWIAGRIVAQEVAAPVAAAAVRFLLAGLVLGAVALAADGELPRPAGRAEWATVAGLALTGIFFYGLCFVYGLKTIPAGRGALVVALNPVLVAALAGTFGNERLRWPQLAGIGLALAGCLAVLGNGDPLALLRGTVGWGELLIVGCVVGWTAYTFIGRRATRTLSPLAATLHASLVGAALLAAASLVIGGVDPASWSGRVWASIAFLAVGGTAVGFTWFADGVRRLGAARASVFINLVPVFAVLQAAVLLDEHLGLPVLAGGALVIAGVWLTTNQQERTA